MIFFPAIFCAIICVVFGTASSSNSLYTGTCHNRCGEYRFNLVSQIGCQCDELCAQMEDCCVDYERICRLGTKITPLYCPVSNNASSDPAITDFFPRSRPRAFSPQKSSSLECRRFNWKRSRVIFGFHAVASCGAEFERRHSRSPTPESLAQRRGCVDPWRLGEDWGVPIRRLMEVIPVTKTSDDARFGVTFANVHCFRCADDTGDGDRKFLHWGAEFLVNGRFEIAPVLAANSTLRIQALLPPEGFVDAAVAATQREMAPCLVQEDWLDVCYRNLSYGPFPRHWTQATRFCVRRPEMLLLFANEEAIGCDDPKFCREFVSPNWLLKTPGQKKGFLGFYPLTLLVDSSGFSVVTVENQTIASCDNNNNNDSNDKVASLFGAEMCRRPTIEGGGGDFSLKATLTQVFLWISLVSLTSVSALLQTSPTKSFYSGLQLQMIVALILNNLLFVTAGFVDGSGDLCKAVAVLLHLFLLAGLSWTTCLAGCICYGLWRLVEDATSMFLVSRPASFLGERKFLGVSAAIWAAPSAIVLFFVLADEALAPGSVGYGASGVCWIGDRHALALALVAPVGVAFLVNLLLILAILLLLRRLSRSGSVSGRCVRRSVNLTAVFFRLAATFGLQWVFGFLLHFISSDVLEFLFVAATSLQGAFVAVAVVVSAEWKQRPAWQSLLGAWRKRRGVVEPDTGVQAETTKDMERC